MGCSPPPDQSVAPALQEAWLVGRVTRTERGGTPVERERQLLGGREREGRSARASGRAPASPWTPAVGSRETGGRCGAETGGRPLGERGGRTGQVAAAPQS